MVLFCFHADVSCLQTYLDSIFRYFIVNFEGRKVFKLTYFLVDAWTMCLETTPEAKSLQSVCFFFFLVLQFATFLWEWGEGLYIAPFLAPWHLGSPVNAFRVLFFGGNFGTLSLPCFWTATLCNQR